MSQDLLKYLSDKIQEEIKSPVRMIWRWEQQKIMGDYKYAVGMIRGLMIANNVLVETSDKMEKFDD